MIRSKRQAQSELGRLAELLFATVREGLGEFRHYGPMRYRHRRRTDANIINDLIVDRAKVNFRGIPGVESTDKRATLYLGFFGRWIVKIKKLDRKLRSRNVETQAVLDFVNQRPDPELPGLEGPTHLHLGYQRNDQVELENSRVFLVCPLGNALAWEWELLEGSSGLLVPAAAAAPPQVPLTREVRPRRVEGIEEQAEVEPTPGPASSLRFTAEAKDTVERMQAEEEDADAGDNAPK